MKSRVHSEMLAQGHVLQQSKRKMKATSLVQESKEVNRMEHLSLDQVNSIQFCVDGAVGLPESVSATRVTAWLLEHDHRQIGDASASSISNPDSDAKAPIFDLHAGWRANNLSATITIICRIDTLEKPSMRPKCVGYSALKLCVDQNGMQPTSSSIKKTDDIFLNAGQFLLPIVYGNASTTSPLSESVMDELPHLYDAFLSVRLFDPRAEGENSILSPRHRSSSGQTARNINQKDPVEDRFIAINSVVHTVVCALPYSAEGVPPMSISDVLVDEIIRNVELDIGEKQIVVKQCMEWLLRIFPPVTSRLNMIDSRYILKYDHKMGIYLALDMLYAMPSNMKLLRRTHDSVRKMQSAGIFTKVYDNRICLYKCYFRYLTGSIIPKRLKSSATDLVVDDASVELDYSSCEFNPVFIDEYSRTTGFELSPNACVLLVVTLVDVLTSSKKSDEKKVSPYFSTGTGKSVVPETLPRSPTRGDVLSLFSSEGMQLEQERLAVRAAQEHAFKLRGLIDLHIGFDDPKGTWWSLLPLMIESPFEKSSARKVGGLMKAVSQVKHMQHRMHAPNSENSLGRTSGYNNSFRNQPLPTSSTGSRENTGATTGNSKQLKSPQASKRVKSSAISPQRRSRDIGSGQNGKEKQLKIDISAGVTDNASPVTPFGMDIDEKDGRLKRRDSFKEQTPSEYFVNAGTHQLPLFFGLPPEEMTRSSNPLAWLISAIAQHKRQYNSSGVCCGGTSASSGAVVIPTDINSQDSISVDSKGRTSSTRPKPNPIGPNDLQLCPHSSSAIVTVVDPRLKQLSLDSVVREANPIVSKEILNRVLRLKASKYDESVGKLRPPSQLDLQKLHDRYKLDLRFDVKKIRTYQEAMPANVLPDALIKEINDKFTIKMSE